MDAAFYSVILGSAIGFITTLASAQYVAYQNKRSQEKSLKLSITLELRDTIKILDEIKNQQGLQNFYDYIQLDTLKGNVESLQSIKKNIHLIKNESVQTNTYSLIGKLSTLSADMRGIQDYEYAKTKISKDDAASKVKLIEKKRNRHAMEMIEIRKDIEDLIKKLT